MSAVTGILGTVNGAATIRNWSIDTTAQTVPYIASNTRGGTVRLPGSQEWTGQFSGYGHTPPVMPGEAFDFMGSVNGEVGASGPAIVDRVTVSLNIERGTPVQWTCDFSSNGALTFGPAVVEDETTPQVPSSAACKVQLGTLADPAVYSDLVDVRSLTLSLECRNSSYRSSSTAGQTKRLPGNLDWSMGMSVYCGDLSELIPGNTIRALRIFVSGTEYWELLWGIFSQVVGLEVNREMAHTLAAQYRVAMNGVTTIGTTGTLGSIKTPSSTTIWPASR